MAKISITRGLTELKTIKKRLKEKIEGTVFIGMYRGAEEKLASGLLKSQMKAETESSLQSIMALIERQSKIKAAIAESNIKTKVMLNKKEMTVEECIAQKSSIEIKEALLVSLKGQLQTADRTISAANQKVEDSIENILKNQGIGVNKNSPEVETYIKSYRSVNEISLFDPIKIRELITSLTDEINNFKSEVDFVLSESNARTEIEI